VPYSLFPHPVRSTNAYDLAREAHTPWRGLAPVPLRCLRGLLRLLHRGEIGRPGASHRSGHLFHSTLTPLALRALPMARPDGLDRTPQYMVYCTYV
jgi:hypothetical protein